MNMAVNPESEDTKLETHLSTVARGPRVTLGQITVLLDALRYETVVIPGTTCTVAAAILPNGFVVAIDKSASASPENFNAEIGKRIAIANAREKAKAKLWEFEGYWLKKTVASDADA